MRARYGILVLAVAALVLTGCSAFGGSSGSPTHVAQSYLEAMAEGDMDMVVDLTQGGDSLPTKADDGVMVSPTPTKLVHEGLKSPIANITIGEVSEGDGTAEVSTSFTIAGEAYDLTLNLARGADGYLVTNEVPLFWLSDIDEEGERTSVASQYFKVGETKIDHQVVRAPFGEYELKPASDSWAVEDAEAVYSVVLAPGAENRRANDSEGEYQVALSGDLTMSDAVDDVVPAVREACDAWAKQKDAERKAKSARGWNGTPEPNEVHCPKGNPVEVSILPLDEDEVSIKVSFDPSGSWVDNQQPQNGAYNLISAVVTEDGSSSQLTLTAAPSDE